MKLELQYLKRVFLFTISVQLCLFAIFGTAQLSGILAAIEGIETGFINLFLLLSLSFLKWSNFLILLSLIFSTIFILYEDFIKNDLNIFFIQIGVSSNKILKCILVNNFFFCFIFFLNNSFFYPYFNNLLRIELLDIAKYNLINRIKPRQMLKSFFLEDFKNLNISVAMNLDNVLYGFLLNSEEFKTRLFVDKLKINSSNLMHFELSEGLLLINNCKTNFKKCEIKINPDIITIKKEEGSLSNLSKFVILLKLLIVTIILSFWAFILIFDKSLMNKIVSSVSFLLLFLNSVSLIKLNLLIFIILSFIIILLFKKGKKCLPF